MSIASVTQVSRMLQIYNENGQLTATINVFSGLIDFTSQVVRVSHMDKVLAYSEYGHLISVSSQV
ncbi:hypothetical protein [Aquirhabdus sp.]|uniref:hypothetical protein n=1 Tax=Aquirhabdus sp. TaxID=2824160 RepID=UPI00396C79DB